MTTSIYKDENRYNHKPVYVVRAPYHYPCTWHDNEDVMRMAQSVDVVTVCSKSLGEKLKKDGCKTPIHVIGDGHDLTKRAKKWHQEISRKVVWFGYSDNQHVLDDYYGLLKELNLTLRVIAEHDKRKAMDRDWETNDLS